MKNILYVRYWKTERGYVADYLGYSNPFKTVTELKTFFKRYSVIPVKFIKAN